MTDKIIQNMISQLGQSRTDRTPKALDVHFSDVDERTPADRLVMARRFAKFVNYYSNNNTNPSNDWHAFFPFDETEVKKLLDDETGETIPHVALFTAFCKLFEKPREVINKMTERHLDFFYQRVLQFSKKLPIPDKAHLLVELKKNSAPISIRPENVFTAGKDKTNVELIYAPTGETVIGNAKVSSLRSIYLSKAGRVLLAPIANSSDGAGSDLPKDHPLWNAFGHEGLNEARVGFAVASPVLRLKEGSRRVRTLLTLSNVDSKLNGAALDKTFDAFITGEKTWLTYGVSAFVSGNVLSLEFDIPASDPAVIDYNPAIHEHAYAAETPVLQFLLKSGNSAVRYKDLKELTVEKVRVEVEVSGITSLVLESDAGGLDPKKAFLPFGPQPLVGSRFMIGYPEALSKKLSEVKFNLQWKGLPESFSTLYYGYGPSVSDSYFTASVSFPDGGAWNKKGVKLFDPRFDSTVHLTFSGTPTPPAVIDREARKVYALSNSGSRWAREAAIRQVRLNPSLGPFRRSLPEPRSSAIVFQLETDFLHALYRVKYVENVMNFSKGTGDDPLVVLNEPYTPAIQSISMSYKARTDDVNIASAADTDFANLDVQLFHAGCFGQMRDHQYLRKQFAFVSDKRVPLLPHYSGGGEFLIGLANLKARDSVSILFEVAEGSADPDLKQEDVQWFVLCDNYWKLLGASEVVGDTTNKLLTSGIITFVVPVDATVDNTIMPPGFIWLKASVADVNAVSQMIAVAANAIEVQFKDIGNDPAHLTTSLEAGRITKMKAGLPELKSIQQPYATFGGKPAESSTELNARASERLRHKNRCVTAWDYERVVLAEFPAIHQVKCIPHARDGAWLSPGYVLVVVVPDLRNKNAMDPLQPRVDADTLSRIKASLEAKAGLQVLGTKPNTKSDSIAVKNPRYQKIQLDFKVRFRTGKEFNFYSTVLQNDLIQFLSPWAHDADRPLSFGGRVYKSVVLDFVEDLSYVDFVTDFKMFSFAGERPANPDDINLAQPETPDAILVSNGMHSIAEVLES